MGSPKDLQADFYVRCRILYYLGYQGTMVAERERVIADIEHNLTRETGFEAVLRVRCSRGLKVISHHGNSRSKLKCYPMRDRTHHDHGVLCSKQCVAFISSVKEQLNDGPLAESIQQ